MRPWYVSLKPLNKHAFYLHLEPCQLNPQLSKFQNALWFFCCKNLKTRSRTSSRVFSNCHFLFVFLCDNICEGQRCPRHQLGGRQFVVKSPQKIWAKINYLKVIFRPFQNSQVETLKNDCPKNKICYWISVSVIIASIQKHIHWYFKILFDVKRINKT